MTRVKNDPAMLESALRGYAGNADNPAYFSSAIWFAHVAGAQLLHKGVTAPIRCAMSRGYSVKLETTGGATWLVEFKTDYLIPSLQRLN